MRPLITEGRLYATVPPLYGGKIKGKMRYFTDKEEFNGYLQKEFSKIHKISNIDGSKMRESDVVSLLNYNSNYVRDITSVADSFAVDVRLLEYILTLQSKGIALDSKQFKKAIESKYRFLGVTKNGIEGLVGNTFQTLFFSDTWLNACQYLYKYFNNRPVEFIIDDQPLSLYDVMIEFDKLSPTSITRYKGLGEMNGDELFNSTLDPAENSGRTLIKYSLEDIEYELSKIREMEDDKLLLFKDIDVSGYTF